MDILLQYGFCDYAVEIMESCTSSDSLEKMRKDLQAHRARRGRERERERDTGIHTYGYTRVTKAVDRMNHFYD